MQMFWSEIDFTFDCVKKAKSDKKAGKGVKEQPIDGVIVSIATVIYFIIAIDMAFILAKYIRYPQYRNRSVDSNSMLFPDAGYSIDIDRIAIESRELDSGYRH